MSAKIAVAIPCYNEEQTIAQVISDFKKALKTDNIHVFDNNSSDESVKKARQTGAHIHHVRSQGKGHVMRAIFDTIVADALIVIDGDSTYSADDVHKLLQPILDGQADMVVGNRLQQDNQASHYSLNRWGSVLIAKIINLTFGTKHKDILSGYRVFSRRFVERIPLLTPKFETETELTIQALEENLDVLELPIKYLPRPQNSHSKLRPFHDGGRILVTMAILLRDHHPLRFYGLLGSVCVLIASIASILKILNFKGIVEMSDSFLAGIILLFLPVGVIIIGIAFVLSAINTKFKELKQIMLRNNK